MKITLENFGEYEQKVWRMECKRSKAMAIQRAGSIVGGIASIPVAIIATIYILCLPEGSMVEELEENHWLWLRPPVFLWEKLCRIILPEGSSTWAYILFSMVAVVLIALAFHILAALVVGLLHRNAPFTPLEGSETKKANALWQRCKAARAASNPSTVMRFWPLVCYSLLWVILLLPSFPDTIAYGIEKSGLIVGLIAGLFAFVFFSAFLLAAYTVPYFVYQWLSGFFRRIQPDKELEKNLEEYVHLCKQQEEKSRRAEEAAKERLRTEEKRKLAEENRKRGDELFQQAISQTPPDDSLIRKAADLGCRPACLNMGQNLMMAFGSDSYTRTEKAGFAETAKRYLKIACTEEENGVALIEAQFLLASFQIMTESGNCAKWRGLLSTLRRVRDSNKLPEHLLSPCDQLIDTVVAQVDITEEEERTVKARTTQAESSGTPQVKRVYCKYFNAGICSYHSSSIAIYHCTNMSNPGQCSTALMEKGLGFEFES